ncbi:MAG TPA: sulfatase-like hydrolase/transferase, partial [Actinomycetota bacterium]|nr:sulfatase-like hydrolase/transferase [Actinomycetota bacterium]
MSRTHRIKSSTWRAVVSLTALLVAFSLGVPPGTEVGGRRQAQAAERPNLLFIMTDDQRVDTMAVMPDTRKRFPVEFTRGFVTTPVCCPSRASLLTGRYAHDTGVRTNGGFPRFQQSWQWRSLGPWLQSRGYYTGFVGKYMNRYSAEDAVPPGWDEFHARIRPTRSGRDGGDGFTSLLMRHWYRGDAPLPDEDRMYTRSSHPG